MLSTKDEDYFHNGINGDTVSNIDVSSEEEESEDKYRIPPTLVHTLDLEPLMNHLATYACTKRGKEAILDLVAMPTTSSIASLLQNSGKRISLFGYKQQRQRRQDWYTERRISWRNDKHARILATPIIPIAQSTEEATSEYQLVHDAMMILKSQQSSNHVIPLPPMFDLYDGVSSTSVDSDDDEWVDLCLAPLPPGIDIYQEIDLQTILQAEQVIKLLLKTYEWATSHQSVPLGLVNVVRQMECIDEDKDGNNITNEDDNIPNINVLRELYVSLKRSVEIVRAGPSLSDPNNSFSYQFQLTSGTGRFPELDNLRNKEEQLLNQKRDNSEQLSLVRGEISILEDLIKRKLITTMIRASRDVQRSMNTLARLDVIFARASFGCDWDGLVPEIGNEGRIHVEKFVHPVLAIEKEIADGGEKAHVITPVDLILPDAEGYQALIISGPNGGGKTLALKSFGLVAIMAKLGLPITTSSGVGDSNAPIVHYFEDILVEVGDSQSIRKQESTLMARLNSLSSLIQKISLPDSSDTKLILLDELGGGTDPAAGSALAQSILEKLISIDTDCRVVATTHSPQLKALSKTDSRFESASVLMGEDKNPTFHLRYGITGDSFALEAARRARPTLPEDVLLRAAELMNGGGEDAANTLKQYLTALEKEQRNAVELKTETETTWKEVLQYKNDMISKLQVSRMQLSRLESRLSSIFDTLKQDDTRETFELVGDSLEELRLMKRKLQTEEDLLSEKGLQRVPDSYCFYEGETVVIIADGEWEGYDAIVRAVDKDDPMTVTVVPVVDFFSIDDDLQQEPIALQRRDLAIFDIPDWKFSDSTDVGSKSYSARKRPGSNVLKVLSTLSTSKIKSSTSYKTKDENTFISARQRKAAAAASKQKKGNKKK
ncbi:hypothetical protein ACHAXH_007265 [Discostella pseudostelligera]